MQERLPAPMMVQSGGEAIHIPDHDLVWLLPRHGGEDDPAESLPRTAGVTVQQT